MSTIAALALAAACNWNTPGSNPTTSPVPASLAAMGINSPELARRIQAGEYAELVTIHKNDRRAHGMSSGNAKWCDGEIDTSRWTDDHEEQGRVYRLGPLAVVLFWRCHNMSIWRAPAAPEAITGPAYMDGSDLIPGGPIGTGPGYAYAIPLAPVIAEGPGGYAGGSWGAAAGFGYAIDYVPSACACCASGAVAAVPEPMVWTLIVGGLGFVVAVTRGKA